MKSGLMSSRVVGYLWIAEETSSGPSVSNQGGGFATFLVQYILDFM